MYNELDICFNTYNNDWNDYGIEIAQKIFKQFKEEDWQELFKWIPKKSDEWKFKLIYSVIGEKNKILTIISLIINTNTENIDILYFIIRILDYYKYDIIKDEYHIFDKNNINIFMNNIAKCIPQLQEFYKDEFIAFLEKYKMNNYNIFENDGKNTNLIIKNYYNEEEKKYREN